MRQQRKLNYEDQSRRSMLMGVLITDMNSTIIYLNQSMCNLCGYSENELLGKRKSLSFLGRFNSSPSTILSAKDLNASELPYRFDITIRKKNSQKIKGMLLASPFYSQDGEQSGWIYLIRDNTNDFNSQTLINDAIASYEKLLNSVNSCISVVTHKPSGNILGMRNDLYVETMGSTVKGHQDISRSFHEPFNAEGKAHGRHLGLLDEEMVQRLREQNYTSRRISRNAPNCARHH